MKKAQEFIDLAIIEITSEVQKVLSDISMSLPEKDSCILPLVQQKRILKQAKSDLDFIDERHHHHDNNQHLHGGTCKLGTIRIENEQNDKNIKNDKTRK